MLEPGNLISDRYRVVRTISETPLATVFECRRIGLESRCVLEVLTSRDARDADAFTARSRAMARVEHPTLARPFDIVDVDGRPAVVRDFMEGQSLASFVGGGGVVSERDAVVLAERVSEALAMLHSHGTIHGKVQPSHIFLESQLSGPAQPRLLGPGILNPSAADLTVDRYTAPELIDGEAPHAGSDIYSLAVVLWELLTSQRLFAEAEDETQLADAITTLGVQIPSGLPPELRVILGRGLAAAPHDRYGRTEEFWFDLRALAERYTTATNPRIMRGGANDAARRAPDGVSLNTGSIAAVLPAPEDNNAPDPGGGYSWVAAGLIAVCVCGAIAVYALQKSRGTTPVADEQGTVMDASAELPDPGPQLPAAAAALGLNTYPLPVEANVDNHTIYTQVRSEPNIFDDNRIARVYNGARVEVLEERCGLDDGRWARVNVIGEGEAAEPVQGWVPVQALAPHRWGCCNDREFDCVPRTEASLSLNEDVEIEHTEARTRIPARVRRSPLVREGLRNVLRTLPSGTGVTIDREVCTPSGYRWAEVTWSFEHRREELSGRGWVIRNALQPNPDGCCLGRTPAIDPGCAE